MTKSFFSQEKILKMNKNFAKENSKELRVFDEPVYMSFVVTPEQRAIIEDALNQCSGRTSTEQLLCLIKKAKKK